MRILTRSYEASSSAIPVVAQAEKMQQTIMIWSVGMFCILCWEWIINFRAEVRYIWRRKLSLISVLYLLNRYFGLVGYSVSVSLSSGAWGAHACNHVTLWNPVVSLISLFIAQMILSMRTFAIWGQNRVIGWVLVAHLLALVVVRTVAYTKERTTSPCSAPYDPRPWMVASWAVPLEFDALTFGLTAWKAWTISRAKANSSLSTLVFRDGLIYFAIIFSMNLANVVTILTLPNGLIPVNVGPTSMCTVLMSCRLALNLRKFAARDHETESAMLTTVPQTFSTTTHDSPFESSAASFAVKSLDAGPN